MTWAFMTAWTWAVTRPNHELTFHQGCCSAGSVLWWIWDGPLKEGPWQGGEQREVTIEWKNILQIEIMRWKPTDLSLLLAAHTLKVSCWRHQCAGSCGTAPLRWAGTSWSCCWHRAWWARGSRPQCRGGAQDGYYSDWGTVRRKWKNWHHLKCS